MTDKLREAAQQVLYVMAMLIDPEKQEPWQIELYDKTVNALRTALAEHTDSEAKDALLRQALDALNHVNVQDRVQIIAALRERLGETK